MLKSNQPSVWYQSWIQFLLQPPFYTENKKDEIVLFINQICEALEQGDSCIELNQCPVILEQLTHHFQNDLPVEKPLVWDAPYLYLQRYWSLEHRLAQKIAVLHQQLPTQIDLTIFADLFTDVDQVQALNVGVNSNFAMITGGPGTGKTYILTRIVAVLKKHDPEMRIAMAAPTGKAAQRMQQALQKAFNDQKLQEAGLYHPDLAQQQTQTLHRLLAMGNRQIARFNQNHPLPYDVVVVDEASMLDLSLAQALFDAIQPSTRLILLGDANQLSSVDVGYVLADLYAVDALKTTQVKLQKSRRFADDANIGRFARYIYQDKAENSLPQCNFAAWQQYVQPEIITSEPIFDFNINLQQNEQEQNLAKDWVGYFALSEIANHAQIQQCYATLAKGYDQYIVGLKAFQNGEITKQQLAESFDLYRILVVMRYFDLGLDAINQAMTNYLRKQLNLVQTGEWFYGRPVMMTYNDYQLGLSNGDIGICIFDQKQPDQYVVYFPDIQKQIAAARLPQSIQTAFALTIHKSQGSEFHHAAVVLDVQAQALLSKELLYTAITRAKKMVSVYSSEQALTLSLQNKTQRKSGLSQQISRLYPA